MMTLPRIQPVVLVGLVTGVAHVTGNSDFKVREIGAPNTKDHILYLEKGNGELASWMHDIPLYADDKKKILNMVVEIPRWTGGKYGLEPKIFLNPITHHTKKNKLIYAENVFPHHGYMWNYGTFPQTWENPTITDSRTDFLGDGDPVDVIEIGDRVGYTGEIKKVKVLGTIALIDDDETDWKVVVIDVEDEKASEMNDIEDVNRLKPKLMEESVKWLKLRKTVRGKSSNQVAFNDTPQNKEVATSVIEGAHEQWRLIMSGELPSSQDGQYEVSCANTTLEWSDFFTEQSDPKIVKIPAADPLPAAEIPPEHLAWSYLPDQ